MSNRFSKLFLLILPFCLAACGEGWEMQRTTNFLPYGNIRTAGSGVMYVRAKMMPEREMNVTPVSRPRDVPEAPPKAAPSQAEQIFEEHQKK